MKYATWRMLNQIRQRQGKEFGKIVQKLLALAFLDAGAGRATDRAIQGIDLEVNLGERKLAIEVKTCEEASFVLSAKDLDGLAGRRDEGFESYLAVLGGRQMDSWLFLPVPGSDLKVGSPMSVTMLRPFADSEFSAIVKAPFVKVVDRHGLEAATDGQLGLNRILQANPRYVRA